MPLPPPPPPSAGGLVLGYSGGRDSTVLLHALSAQAQPLRAVHIHHGLQPAADDFAAHCQMVCDALSVPLTIIRVRVRETGDGPEAAARAARLAAFRSALKAGEILVLAHHADDQVETVLARLLRGTGPAGLAGMRAYDDSAGLRRWRPLLDVPAADLAAYAAAHGLRWIEDPHNADLRYERVWLRQRVLPELRSRRPGLGAAVTRLARQLGDEQDQLAQQDLARLPALTRNTAWGVVIDGEALLALDPATARRLLRCWWARQGGAPMSAAVVDRVLHEVLPAAADRQPSLRLGATTLRRYRGALYCDLGSAWVPPPRWTEGCRCDWPGQGHWQSSAPPSRPLQGGYVTPGLRLQRSGDAQPRRISSLLQALGMPPWLRARTPLLWDGNTVVAVAGLSASASAPADLRWVPIELNGRTG